MIDDMIIRSGRRRRRGALGRTKLSSHGISREQIRGAVLRHRERKRQRRVLAVGLVVAAAGIGLVAIGLLSLLMPDWLVSSTISALNHGLAFSHVRKAAVLLLKRGKIRPVSVGQERFEFFGGLLLIYLGAHIVANRRSRSFPLSELLTVTYWTRFRKGLAFVKKTQSRQTDK